MPVERPRGASQATLDDIPDAELDRLAAMGLLPMCKWMPTGLPALSSKKSTSGSLTSTGFPRRISYFVFMLLPTTCSGEMT